MKLYHFTKANRGLGALRDQRLKIARIHELNDPFELLSARLKTRDHRKKFRNFKKWMAEKYGILCFSKGWDNPLLWSHYTDRHKGVALEFVINDEDLIPVDYKPSRIKLDVSSAIQRNTFIESDVHSPLSTKFEDWSYEDEMRIFTHLERAIKVDNLFFEPFSERLTCTGIVLGSLCKIEDCEIESTLPKGHQIQRTAARLAFKSFGITVQNRRPITTLIGSN